MIATLQQQSCKGYANSVAATLAEMEGVESDTALVQALCKYAKLVPSALAREIDVAATTILRPYKGRATTRLSQPTLEKMKRRWPDFPGWRNELPDQVGMLGKAGALDPNERPDDLVYIREVDINLAMGDGATVEDFPATQLVPFNVNFVRGFTRAAFDKLVIMTGHGESMEPTLLRSDFLMIDTGAQGPVVSDTIWAFHYAGGGYIKRLRRVREEGEDRFMILSDNPAVPPQVANVEDVHIIGKLVWIGRRM